MVPWSQQLFFPHRCCSTCGTPSHLNFLTSNEKRGDGKGTQMSFSVRIFAPEPNNASLWRTVFAALFWDFLLKRLSSSPDVKVCFITNTGKACRCMKCADCLELPSKQCRTKWVWVFWKIQTSFFFFLSHFHNYHPDTLRTSFSDSRCVTSERRESRMSSVKEQTWQIIFRNRTLELVSHREHTSHSGTASINYATWNS